MQNKKKIIAYLGIGTNKGSRSKNIRAAIKLLKNKKDIKVLKISKPFKNPPQEGIKSGYFLNGAIKILTSIKPLELLNLCKEIEEKLGRKKVASRSQRTRKKSRVIDLDILFYENQILKTKKLVIPHPRLHKRDFVLIPMNEIGRDFMHPVLKKSIRELFEELK